MFGRALHIRKVIANIPDSRRGRNERWSRLDISAELICISETPHHTSLSRHTRNTAGILPRIHCKRSPNCQCYSQFHVYRPFSIVFFNRFLIVKVLVAAFNKEKALVS